MKKQYLPVTDTIDKFAPVWQSRLKLDHFDIEHIYLDEFFPDDDTNDDFKVTATTDCRWNYFEAKIKWYLPSAVRHSAQRLEETLVHELVHVLLCAEQSLLTTSAASDRLEMSTELVSRALWNCWNEAA